MTITLPKDFQDFKQQTWFNVGVKMMPRIPIFTCNIKSNGPILTLLRPCTTTAIFNIFAGNYTVTIDKDDEKIVVFTSTFINSIVHKFIFKNASYAESMCHLANMFNEDLLNLSLSYSQKPDCVNKGIISSDKLFEPGELEIYTDNNSIYIKIKKVEVDSSYKTIFMTLLKNTICISFLHECPPHINAILAPSTISFADLKRPHKVVYFICNSPGIAASIVLSLSMISFMRDGFRPTITKKPTQEEKEENSKKSVKKNGKKFLYVDLSGDFELPKTYSPPRFLSIMNSNEVDNKDYDINSATEYSSPLIPTQILKLDDSSNSRDDKKADISLLKNTDTFNRPKTAMHYNVLPDIPRCDLNII